MNIQEQLTKYQEALQLIAGGTSHAKEIANRALGWPDNQHYHIELLREENLELKMKLEQLQKKMFADVFGTSFSISNQ